MDERALKRLLVIVAVSIVAIMLFKVMMSKTIVNLNSAVTAKKAAEASSRQQATSAPDAAVSIVPETSAASTVSEVAIELSASGVSEAR